MRQGMGARYLFLIFLCSMRSTIYAGNTPTVGYIVVENASRKSDEIHERRCRDMSSPGHVANRWRSHSFNNNYHAAAGALFNGSSTCASWSVEDYRTALFSKYGQVIPYGYVVSPTLKACYRYPDYAVYVDDAHYKDNVDKLKKLIDQAKNGVENADKLGKNMYGQLKILYRKILHGFVQIS